MNFQINVMFYGSNGSENKSFEVISIFSKGRGLRKDKIFNFIKNEEYFSNEANFVDEEIEYELKAYSDIKNNKFQKIKLNGEISVKLIIKLIINNFFNLYTRK